MNLISMETRHALSGVSTISKSSGHDAISRWTPSDVSAFVSNIPGCEAYGAAFEEEAVDGEALMLLHQVGKEEEKDGEQETTFAL